MTAGLVERSYDSKRVGRLAGVQRHTQDTPGYRNGKGVNICLRHSTEHDADITYRKFNTISKPEEIGVKGKKGSVS